MKFNPARIDNIRDVLPVIKDIPAFTVREKGWYTVIDYNYMSDDMFNHPIERECRGIKFDTRTGEIIARPYHKFHNLGERDGYRTSDVNLSNPHVILDKLDGSMVHTCPSKLGLYLMTRAGITEVALQAEKFLSANQLRYGALFNSLGWDEYTYIFEYIGPNNKIVVNYEKEDLVLTAIRHVRNGTYVFHDEMIKLGKLLNIPVVPNVTDLDDIVELAETIKGDDLPNQEGVVVRFDTGAMVKIKSDAYVLKHRSKDLVSSQRGVLSLIFNNNVDDVIPQLDPEVVEKLRAYEYKVLGKLEEISSGINQVVNDTRALTQKEFALGVMEEPKMEQSVYFNVRKGVNAWDALKEKCCKYVINNKKTEELVEGLDLPKWTFSFFQEE